MTADLLNHWSFPLLVAATLVAIIHFIPFRLVSSFVDDHQDFLDFKMTTYIILFLCSLVVTLTMCTSQVPTNRLKQPTTTYEPPTSSVPPATKQFAKHPDDQRDKIEKITQQPLPIVTP